jgi:UDP-N-acetylglucosamine 2-epimerase (non-hydrolysing)
VSRARVKVLSVFGTRPEAIKMAPVLHALAADPAFDSRVCVTAQHRDLLDPLLALFKIGPDHDLDLMVPAQTLQEFTARALLALADVFARERPDCVLVQGDTTTTMIGALAAFYARARVGHVEAGLRTRRLDQPFPEEANRRMVGVVADFHFAPTEQAKRNLLAESVAPQDVFVTGNTAIDALMWASAIEPGAEARALIDAFRGDVILVTAHRRESFGAPLLEICGALADLAARFRDRVQIVYPVHPNPNVIGPVRERLGHVANITLLPPVEYLTLVHLLKRATLVLTDSGGLQEEAPSLGRPVLVMRDRTERPEGIEAGTARLVGTDRARIVQEASRLLEDERAYREMAQAVNPYGDGQSAGRIVAALRARLLA